MLIRKGKGILNTPSKLIVAQAGFCRSYFKVPAKVVPTTCHPSDCVYLPDWFARCVGVGRGSRESFFSFNSLGQSQGDRVFMDFVNSAKFRKRSSHAFYSISAIISPVVSLLLRSSPSAIFRGVIGVAIDPIKGMFGGWLRSHVGKEICKSAPLNASVCPSLTDTNPTSPILRPVSRVGIMASARHSFPASIFRGHLSGLSVKNRTLARHFPNSKQSPASIMMGSAVSQQYF